MSDAPLTEQLDLDISAALSQLENLGSALDTLVTSFQTGMETALSDLSSGLNVPAVDVPVEADTTAATDEIAALADVQLSLFPDADVSAAADSISALDAETVTVPVDADTAPAQASLDDLTATPIVVPVEADTTDAETAITDLGSSADTASGGVNGLKAATSGLDAAAGAAVGSTGGLQSVISGLGPGAAAAVAGVGAFAGFLKAVIPLAADAQAQTARFNETFGVLAEQVQHIDVGGLNTTLSDLGKQSGTLNADLEASASKIGLFGKSAGASGEQVVQTTDNVLALAGALAVQNPRLGDASTVADKLNRALVTGGRFAQQLGLSLQAADIKARAQEIAGAGNEVTRFDLLTAGAQLTVEQFGNTLGTTFQQGAQNAQIQLRALGTQIKETLIAIGQPLLGPLTSDLQAFLPVAQALGNVFGSALGVLLPLLQAFAPLLAATATALNLVATALGAIPSPVLEAVAIILTLSTALNVLLGVNALVIRGLAFLIPALAEFATTSAEASAAATVLGTAMDLALGPIGLAIAAITIIAGVLGVFSKGAKDAAASADVYNEALVGTASTAQDLQNKLSGANTAISEQLAKNLAAGKDAGTVTDVINTLGLSYSDLAKGISGTQEQYGEFIANLDRTAQGSAIAKDGIDKLLNSLAGQRQEIQATASAQVDQLVASGQITQAQLNQARAFGQVNDALAGTTDQVGSYIDVLKKATEFAIANQKATEAQGLATGQLQQAFLDLKPAIAAGTVTAASAQQVADQLGISVDDAKAAINGLSQAMTDFVNTGVAALPQASAAFDDFQKNVDSAFSAVVSAGSAAGPGGAIASAVQGVAQAQQQANLQVANAGQSGAATIDAAKQQLTDAQQRLADAQGQGVLKGATQIATAERAVQTAQDNLAKAEARAGDAQAKAILTGNQQVQAARDKANQAQADESAKVKKAQDDLLFALDPQRVIDAENKNTLAILAFQQNLTTLIARGHADTVALLVAEGPAKGAQLAQSLVTDDSKAKALDAGVALANKTTDGYRTFLESHRAELAGRLVTLANGQVIDLTNTFNQLGQKAGGALLEGVAAGLSPAQVARIAPGIIRGEGLTEHAVQPLVQAISAQAVAAGQAAASGFTNSFKVAAPAGVETAAVGPAITAKTPANTDAARTASTAVTTAFMGGLNFAVGLPAAFLAFDTALDHEANIAAVNANLAGGRVGHAFGVGFRDALALGLTAGGPIPLPSLAPTGSTATVPNVRPPTTIPTGSGAGQAHTTSTATRTAEVNVTLNRTDPNPFQLAQEIGFAVG